MAARSSHVGNRWGDHDHNGLIYILFDNLPNFLYLKRLIRGDEAAQPTAAELRPAAEARGAALVESLERRRLFTADFGFISTAGGGSKDKATDVAVDSAGNAYVVGVYNGAVDFDPSRTRAVTLPNSGSDDAFLAKYSSSGALLWAVPFSGSGPQQCQSVALDPSGNVLVTGWFSSTVDFNPSSSSRTVLTSKGGEDAFVAKLTANGSFLWSRRFGGAGREGGLSVAADASGNVLMQGMYDGSGDYDPGAGTAVLSCAGSYDVSLVKLDANGRFVWVKRFGGSGVDMGNGLAVDRGGNVISVGSFYGSVDFNPTRGTRTLASAGGSDVFVSKLSAGGAYVWSKRMGGSGADTGGDVAVDSAGDVYTTGSFSGSADFDSSSSATYTRTSKGGSDVFISKLSSGGSFVWAKSLGRSGNDKGNGIAVDSSGVYLTGKFAGAVDFNPSSSSTYTLNSSAGTTDIFALKLSPGGSFAWARRFGGSSSLDEGESITVRSGRLRIAGGFSGTVDFDPNSGTASRSSSGSQHDLFLLGLSNV